ncbi:MAG: flagellar basal body-associated protein FliL [Clostridia bacterium]|jgi:flagellar basal body-associated protein FliL|nr:flagellar basal body-associated protein FliL [Clostridia bacterium]
MERKNFVLIAIIILLLFIILSGIILYIFVLNKPEELGLKEITIDKEIVLYDFGSSFVNNVKDSKKITKVTVKLDVNLKLVELLDNRKSEIIDRINLIMRGKAEKDLVGVEGQLKIKAEIREAIKKILSTDKKIEVYIEELIVQ